MKPWMSLALMGMLAGCDAQTGEQYRGEPLFTMTGSVELALTVEDQEELIPALAFRGLNSDLYLMDADVEGQFPAEFTLNVYEPPPEAAMQVLGDYHAPQPRLAIGYVTAVTPETPAMFHYSQNQAGSGSCWPDAETGLRVCEERTEWCTNDDSECYVEVKTCHDADNHPDDCTVEAEGDPTLKRPLEESFAGLSENFLVLWLEEPAAPRTWIAYAVGQRDEGLAKGYHLLATSEAPESDEPDICADQADALAVERTNERFGTSYGLEELSALCDVEENCPNEEIYAAFRQLGYAAEVELDCPDDDVEITRVEDPANERITVRIGPDLKGF